MRRTFVPIVLAVLLALPAAAQKKPVRRKRPVVEAPPEPPRIFRYVSQQVTFPGDVYDYLARNIRYPELSRENREEGRVIITFVVGTTGTVDTAWIQKSAGSTALDREALRVVRSMPAWKPARLNGRAVNSRLSLPVLFRFR